MCAYFVVFCPIIINLQVIAIGSDDDSQLYDDASLSGFSNPLLADCTGTSHKMVTVSYTISCVQCVVINQVSFIINM